MPNATTEPTTTAEWRLPAGLVELIYAEVFRPLSDADDPARYHNILQRRLKALGERLGYEARLEYPTPWIDQHRSGRIDVVWTAPSGCRSVAIEIDTTWKRNSITKLLYIARSHQPVWIFLGGREVPHIPADDEMAKIHLIRADPARVLKPRERKRLPGFAGARSAAFAIRVLRRRRRRLAAIAVSARGGSAAA